MLLHCLGGKQMELLHSLKQLGKPIISILIQGRPYDIEELLNFQTR